jgi:hypothetical protein
MLVEEQIFCGRAFVPHKMWGPQQKFLGDLAVDENMLPDSKNPFNDTCTKEIALKAIFDESGRRL